MKTELNIEESEEVTHITTENELILKWSKDSITMQLLSEVTVKVSCAFGNKIYHIPDLSIELLDNKINKNVKAPQMKVDKEEITEKENLEIKHEVKSKSLYQLMHDPENPFVLMKDDKKSSGEDLVELCKGRYHTKSYEVKSIIYCHFSIQ